MKRNFKIIILLILLFPLTMKAQLKTLQDYINMVNKYQDELNNANAKVNAASKGIIDAKNNINYIKNQQIKLSNEIALNQEKMQQYKKEIKKKKEELKRLINYTSVADSSNFYLDYIFDSNDVTDFIYRSTVSEQVINAYHHEGIKLENLVKKIIEREKEINKIQKQMIENQKRLEASIVKLGEVKASYETAGVSALKQLQIYKEQTNAYIKLGCKPHHVIGRDCAVSQSAGVFRRPVDRGMVTQNFGRTSFNPFHRGLDIARYGSSSSPKIYPVANGTITSIYNDNYGAKCISIEYYKDGVYYSSLYAHLDSYAPGLYVGKKVSSDDYIGFMGASGKAYGVHLHFEMAQCRLWNPGDKCRTWGGWTNFVKSSNQNPRRWIAFPSVMIGFTGR